MKTLLILVLAGILTACTPSDPTRANIENLMRGKDITIEEISTTVQKTINGKVYSVAKVKIKGKNGFNAPVEQVLGYVADSEAGYYYTMGLDVFQKFLETGDKTGFPEIEKPLSVDTK